MSSAWKCLSSFIFRKGVKESQWGRHRRQLVHRERTGSTSSSSIYFTASQGRVSSHEETSEGGYGINSEQLLYYMILCCCKVLCTMYGWCWATDLHTYGHKYYTTLDYIQIVVSTWGANWIFHSRSYFHIKELFLLDESLSHHSFYFQS